MAKLKNGQTLRKVKLHPETVKAKQRIDWGHKNAALAALEPESEAYETPQSLGVNGVEIVGKSGFRIDDVTGRNAVAKFRRPDGTPSYFEVFGKDKPKARSLGENILIIRAWMHLEGHPPLPERSSVQTFATVSARFFLPRYKWPLFSQSQKAQAAAFIAEWADKLYDQVSRSKAAKSQRVLPGWAQPDRAAFYTPDSIATEQRFTRERRPAPRIKVEVRR